MIYNIPFGHEISLLKSKLNFIVVNVSNISFPALAPLDYGI